MDPVILEARGLTFRYRPASAPAVDGVDLTLAPGDLLAIVGPNGGGKTTLLRLLLGVLAGERGAVAALGRPVRAWDRRELARVIAVMVQREEAVFPLRVREAVMLGRYPHLGPLGAPRLADREAVERALSRCDLADLAERWTASLSGGEWQRVRIARALAQEPRALVLDEPTANLDIGHEMQLFELVADLVHRDGLAALIVTHHLNLAARYADRLVVLHRGRVAAAGTAAQVMRRDVLEPVFGWPVEVAAWRGLPQFVPLKHSEVKT
jgi:iron complex transport system ATP-binding protein